MNKLNIKDFINQDITINIIDSIKEKEIIIKFTGKIDSIEPQNTLNPFFDNFHEKIIENDIKIVICDIKDLNFINSSGIKCLIIWILKIQNINIKNQYEIHFLIDYAVLWQKNSIKFLTSLMPDKIKIIDY